MTLLGTIVPPDAPARPGQTGPLAWTRQQPTVVWSAKACVITAVALIFVMSAGFCHWLWDQAVVPWDSKNQFYPMFQFLADALRHGTVPLWNPYQFSGYPAIADPQSLIFTPSMVLFALLAPNASMTMFDAVIFAHLATGGLGILLLGRRWGWHPVAAFMAALVFALGGSAAGRLEHTGMIISYSYFPWALYALQGALQRRSLPWAAAAGLTVTLMAVGRDQVAFLLCLALAAAVLGDALSSRTPVKYLLSRATVLLCAGIVTVALMIVPILLTLQFVHDSNRPSITYGVALAGSLNPVNLLTLIAPGMFGTLDKVYDYWGPGTGLIAGNDWTDKTDRTIDYLFIGTVPCVLLIWHGLAAARLFERDARFFALMGVLILLYALGRYTPVFGLIFDLVPGVSLYRRPADASFPLNAALAFGAGYLLNRFIADGLPRALVPSLHRFTAAGGGLSWQRPLASAATGLAFAAVTLTALAVTAIAGLAFAARYGHARDSALALLLATALAAAVTLALILFRRPGRRVFIATVLTLATSGELLARNTASAVNAEPVSTYSAYSGLYPDERAGLEILRADMARDAAEGKRPRVELIGVNGSWQNAAMVLKLEDTIGYNPLRMSDYERAVGPHESATEIDQRQFPGLFRGYTGRLASELGLDYLVLDRPLDRLPRHFPRPPAQLLFAGQGFYVYRLDNVIAPRAIFVPRARLTDSEAVLSDEIMPDFDPAREALIDRKDAGALSGAILDADNEAPDASQAAPGPAPVLTAYGNDKVTIEATATAPGILVLHDLYYPGWTAEVDGHSVPVLRANILFRGVALAPGHHVVTFRFEPLRLANLARAAINLWRPMK